MRSSACRLRGPRLNGKRTGRPTADDLGRYLAGTWRIVRVCLDVRLQRTSRLFGHATFSSTAGGLRYDECGMLHIEGTQVVEARQTYLYNLCGPITAEVAFADGRPFHTLDIAHGIAPVHHACPPDLYRGRYRLLDADRWTLAWAVSGPRKQQLIGTTFHRVAANGPAHVRDGAPFATEDG